MLEFKGRRREKAILVGLDAANHPIKAVVLGDGTSNSTVLDMEKVCKFSCGGKIKSAVLLHNHPSGFAFPSLTDGDSTYKIRELLEIMGIQMVDHLIYDPDGDFVSVSDSTDGFKKPIPTYNVILRENGTGAVLEYNRGKFVEEIKGLINCEKTETKSE